jgi:hypothetical protein
MARVSLVLPVAAEDADDTRAFMPEPEQERKADYDASERRIGISKEVWFLAPLGDRYALVAYMEADDFQGALEKFVTSQDDFDLWFKRRLADSTGLDLNIPPDVPLPELLSSYAA